MPRKHRARRQPRVRNIAVAITLGVCLYVICFVIVDRDPAQAAIGWVTVVGVLALSLGLATVRERYFKPDPDAWWVGLGIFVSDDDGDGDFFGD